MRGTHRGPRPPVERVDMSFVPAKCTDRSSLSLGGCESGVEVLGLGVRMLARAFGRQSRAGARGTALQDRHTSDFSLAAVESATFHAAAGRQLELFRSLRGIIRIPWLHWTTWCVQGADVARLQLARLNRNRNAAFAVGIDQLESLRVDELALSGLVVVSDRAHLDRLKKAGRRDPGW